MHTPTNTSEPTPRAEKEMSKPVRARFELRVAECFLAKAERQRIWGAVHHLFEKVLDSRAAIVVARGLGFVLGERGTLLWTRQGNRIELHIALTHDRVDDAHGMLESIGLLLRRKGLSVKLQAQLHATSVLVLVDESSRRFRAGLRVHRWAAQGERAKCPCLPRTRALRSAR